MRFISWNVNGLRAVLKKGFEDIVGEFDADIVALQETKLQAGQATLDLPQYREFWSYADRKGYSGTAVFTKDEPLQVLHGLGFPHLDDEGRIVALEFPGFWFVDVYTPNAQNELARIDHRMEWDDAFRDFCKGLGEGILPAGVPVERAGADGLVVMTEPPVAPAEESASDQQESEDDKPAKKKTSRSKKRAEESAGPQPLGEGHLDISRLPLTQPGEKADPKPVVMCGDFNVAHEEIDLKNPGPNRGNAGFSDEEREKFTKLLDAGFVDTFRSLHPDEVGAYSWWSYRFNARKNNAGWRIDYFLVSEALRDRVRAASIYPEVFGSDHCPVGLELAEEPTD